jgi:hypothetical protein
MHVSSDSLTSKNRSEPVDCKKSTEALYLLGNIQSGKSEKKLQSLGQFRAASETPLRVLHLFKEHREGEK